ncbi:hypothetical protein GCM10009785_09090 [Brooklawnia cerclae]
MVDAYDGPVTVKASSRQAIVDAAAQLIRASGVQGTSISDLIAASGTSAGAIYHHFPSKNAIVVEVAREAMAWPMAALAEYRDRPASPSDLLSYAMTALTDAPELGDLLIALGAGAATDDDLGQQLRDEVGRLRDSVEETMLAWAMANGVPHGRVQGYSQLLIGLTLGFVSQRRLVSNFDEQSYAAQAVRLMALPQAEG